MRHAPIALALALLALAAPSRAPAAARWRAAYVVDARLALLRASPDLAAAPLRRLRAGRRVAVVGARRDRDGYAWARVAVTRRTRGWVLADALAAPGDAAGERRLAGRIDGLRGLARLELARLAIDRFPRLRAAGSAAAVEEAEAAAAELSERSLRRLGPLAGEPPERVRALMLSDPALDRYARLGVTFEADPARRAYSPRPLRPPPR